MMKKLIVLSVLLAVVAIPAGAMDILAPGDTIIAIDEDGIVSNSSYPDAEGPLNILDNNADTKYLNFAGSGSGFIVETQGLSVVKSFTITTANDAADRDPTSWTLYGTNDAITSLDNSTGNAENWSLIDSGSISLPAERKTLGPVVTVNNDTAYSSYRMLYPNLGGSNLMQIADVSIYESIDGTGNSVLGVTDTVLAIHQGWDSRYPGAENPGNLIDGSLNKYLNVGQVNSGFIVTPSMGASIVTGFQITTANDSPERDPATWSLYGTNEAVTSEDNSDGTGENWVLIETGTLDLPEDRDTLADAVAFDNDVAYTSYKFVVDAVKDADTANSMQIAEIQFTGVPEPATLCLLGLGAIGLVRRRR